MSILVFDIGGSNIKQALMDRKTIVKRGEKVRTPRDSLDGFLQILLSSIESYRSEIEGIAISAPGWIDADCGYFHHGGALHYLHNVNLVEILQETVSLPVTVENDANCAALAELWMGTMREARNGLVIVVGTGVGGGLIIDHKLYRGSYGGAGEIGQILASVIDDTGETFGSYCRSHALLDDYEYMIGAEADSIRGIEFYRRLEMQESDAISAMKKYCARMIRGIVSIHAVLDLERIAFGGGYSNEPLFLSYLKEAQDDWYSRIDPLFRPNPPELLLCECRSDANLYGALYHYHQKRRSEIADR